MARMRAPPIMRLIADGGKKVGVPGYLKRHSSPRYSDKTLKGSPINRTRVIELSP
jgi:hypothetical protein